MSAVAAASPMQISPDRRRGDNATAPAVDVIRSSADPTGSADVAVEAPPRENDAGKVRIRSRSDSTIESLKLDLYVESTRVHRGRGAEKRFAEYWDALCRHVSGGVDVGVGTTTPSPVSSTSVIDAFLTTKSLRRKHNALVLGLIKQCYQSELPATRYRRHVPVQWRNRVRVVQRRRRRADEVKVEVKAEVDVKLEPRKEEAETKASERQRPDAVVSSSSAPSEEGGTVATTEEDEKTKQKKRKKIPATPTAIEDDDDDDRRMERQWHRTLGPNSGAFTAYGNECAIAPVLVDDAPPSAATPFFAIGEVGSTVPQQENGVYPLLPSGRLPGALQIDTLVRNRAGRQSMTASENAVWLLVVAVREHAAALMKEAMIRSAAIRTRAELEPLPSPTLRRVYQEKEEGGDGDDKKAGDKDARGTKKRPSESTTGSGSGGGVDDDSERTKKPRRHIITTRDLAHVLSTNPIVAGGSVGSSYSRLAWERCINAAGGTTTVPVSLPPNLGTIQAALEKDIGRGVASANLPPPPAPEAAATVDAADGAVHPIGQGERPRSASPGGARRGRGFGVKNLAAMRSRSVTLHRPGSSSPPPQQPSEQGGGGGGGGDGSSGRTTNPTTEGGTKSAQGDDKGGEGSEAEKDSTTRNEATAAPARSTGAPAGRGRRNSLGASAIGGKQLALLRRAGGQAAGGNKRKGAEEKK